MANKTDVSLEIRNKGLGVATASGVRWEQWRCRKLLRAKRCLWYLVHLIVVNRFTEVSVRNSAVSSRGCHACEEKSDGYLWGGKGGRDSAWGATLATCDTSREVTVAPDESLYVRLRILCLCFSACVNWGEGRGKNVCPNKSYYLQRMSDILRATAENVLGNSS